LNVTAGVVDEATLHGPYQAVLGLDVIEHVPAPHETVRQLSTHMERGGVLLMTTGDWASAMARITGPHWRLMTPPQHLSFFTPRGMRAMLEAAGFRVTSLTHPVKHVPLSLIAYQLQRMAGMRPRNVAWLGGSFPVNLFDAMRVVAVKV
jgi:2-polyprenyl-3-methyl-5-hydroxy-6-metoxy-1,4-benzoquinol methylase